MPQDHPNGVYEVLCLKALMVQERLAEEQVKAKALRIHAHIKVQMVMDIQMELEASYKMLKS